MGRLLSRFMVSPRAKRRARIASLIIFALLAALGWWGVAEDGATPARLIAAIAATAAVILDALLPKRRRLRRAPAAADPQRVGPDARPEEEE